MPDESGAARLHIELIDNLNARLPLHTPIACDGFITLGLWLSVSIRSRFSSLTSHLRYVKPEMLSLALWVIAHLWAGTAHRPTIGNNVTPDPYSIVKFLSKSEDSSSVSIITDFFHIINAKWNSKYFLHFHFKKTIISI